MEEGEVPVLQVSQDKSALLAALRARIKRDRPPSPPPPQEVAMEPGEVREWQAVEEREEERGKGPMVEDNSLVIDLDELSSDEECAPVSAALDRSETLSRLQALIEEKERDKRLRQQEREEDVGLLQTKLAAQEALLARVVQDIREREMTLKDLSRRAERSIPGRLEELRKMIERLNAQLAEAETEVAALCREKDDVQKLHLPEARRAIRSLLETKVDLNDKIETSKSKIATLLPPPPSPLQIEQAAQLHMAFALAGPGEEACARATFGHVWAHDARPLCARLFRGLGAKVQQEEAAAEEKKAAQQEPKAGAASLAVPYESPLLALRSYRLAPAFAALLGAEAVGHPSFSNRVAPDTVLCRFDLGGVCNDENCPFLHARDYEMGSGEQVVDDLVKYQTSLAPFRAKSQALHALRQAGLPQAVAVLAAARPSLFVGPPRRQRKVVELAKARDKGKEEEDEEEEEPAEPSVSESVQNGDDEGEGRAAANAAEDPEVRQLGATDPHNVRRWLELAARYMGRLRTLPEAAGVCAHGLEHNPTSAALWLFYIDVVLRVQEVTPDPRRVEMVFEGATRHVPFSVSMWAMFVDWQSDFASKDRVSLRAVSEAVAGQVHAVQPTPLFQGVLFQLLVLRMRVLVTAGRPAKMVRAEMARWSSFLGPWQLANINLLCVALEFGALRVPELSPGLFAKEKTWENEYVIVDMPASYDSALLASMVERIQQDNASAFHLGADARHRLPFLTNMVRLRLLQGNRGQAFALVVELLQACPDHCDVHWLAGQVLVDSVENVAPFLATKFVFALSAMAEQRCPPPVPPLADETLSEAEQVCAWLCAGLASPRDALFQEARYGLRVQCADKAALAVFWASYIAFAGGRSATAPFETLLGQAHADLMVPASALQSTRTAIVELLVGDYLPSPSARRHMFECVAIVALAPLPSMARRRVVEETPDNDGLVLWSIYMDMMTANISMDSCRECRRMAMQLIKRSATNWDAWHLLVLLDWISDGVGSLISRTLSQVAAALKTMRPVVASIWAVVLHVMRERKHPALGAMTALGSRVMQSKLGKAPEPGQKKCAKKARTKGPGAGKGGIPGKAAQ